MTFLCKALGKQLTNKHDNLYEDVTLRKILLFVICTVCTVLLCIDMLSSSNKMKHCTEGLCIYFFKKYDMAFSENINLW